MKGSGVETYAVRDGQGFPEGGCVGFKVRIEPGAPETHPYQDALDWWATGHRDADWTFAAPLSPRPPVRAIVATHMAQGFAAMARSAWWVAVLAAGHMAHMADSRAARLGRPMRPKLVPDYRRRIRQRYAFLVYAIVITALIGWPNFLLAYQDVLAHVHAAVLTFTHSAS